MGKFTHLYLVLLACFALTVFLHAQDQSGFISLDCGAPANSYYTEKTTGLAYTSDASFIDTGISKSISTEFTKSSLQEQLWNVRSFPEGIRNCYYIKLTSGDRYLIRGTFMYGNYDDQGKIPEFDLHLGVEKWDSVKLQNAYDIIYKEIIHVPSLNHIHVCLLNTGLGTPFISALEVRPLNNSSYVTQFGRSLTLFKRLDCGTVTNKTFRYKDDTRDRIWSPYTNCEWTPLSHEARSIVFSTDSYEAPSIVLSIAATPKNASAPLIYQLELDDSTSKFYIYMYFSEVVLCQANQYRAFNVKRNSEHFAGPIVPTYLGIYTMYSSYELSGGKNVFSIEKLQNSTLPPIINAIEVYRVKEFSESETDQEDVDAVMKIKSMYGVTRNWQGDPCAPQAYLWDGLQCSYVAKPYRIISLILSSSGLTGEIAPSISNLKMLQILDPSNKNLTELVPDFLWQLPSLTVLNLERNMLTGSVPVNLIERSNNHSLLLSVGGNPKLCSSLSCKKKNNIIVPVVATVGGLFILLLTAAAIFWSLKRRKQGLATSNAVSNNQYESLDSRKRKFTYSDIVRITKNFERVLGRGGFGAVYHGYIDDTQVAVKVLSPSSTQGYQQFHAKVGVLMRVHHRNLTALVGYCNEGTNMGLIYEYMTNGDLASHLSDDSKANILRWEVRVRIALDAAHGLEYLHNGCKPPIVHRDVKCTNILLNEDFCAKLADFGLSKSFPIDSGTHMSTVVAGTHGYLDPDYYTKNRLTEKSDVYSFRIVLLKIITCQPVIGKDEEHTHIVEWVNFVLANGDIQMIIDPKLQGDLEINSVWKAVKVAMACVSQTSIKRPTMSQVVVELKECLAIELARKQGREAELRDPVELFSVNSISELNPSPR